MSYLIKMKGSKKKHILIEASSRYTICGRKVKSGEILDMLPREEEWNLCHHCYAWIGEQMVDEWFGLDFIE